MNNPRARVLAPFLVLVCFVLVALPVARAEGYGSQGDREIKDEAARMTLAPHTLMVETQLMSALDQVRGLKAQVRTAQSQPTQEFLEHYKEHRREINDSVKAARNHEGRLKESATRFPTIARTEQFKALNPAITELERVSKQWEQQAAARNYWMDATRVSSDLDQLEKRLMMALEKTRSLNSKLDVSEIG